MAEHKCALANCDGTRLGHELARDFPEETARLVDSLARLGSREDRVIAANLQLEYYTCQMCPSDAFQVPVDEIGASLMQQHLKTEHDVETRFQLGYAMGKQGLSGTEDQSEA